MRNALKYGITLRAIMTINKTVPEHCPIYVVTNEGVRSRCPFANCKKCCEKWIGKEAGENE